MAFCQHERSMPSAAAGPDALRGEGRNCVLGEKGEGRGMICGAEEPKKGKYCVCVGRYCLTCCVVSGILYHDFTPTHYAD